MKKVELIIFATLTTLLLTSSTAFSAFAITAAFPTFTLSSSSTQIPYMLPQGTTFNGSISTTGTVRFFVSAPNGTIIVNLGLIDKNVKFGFVAQQTGNYTINFENDLPNSIQITFSYVTNPDISGSDNSTGIPLSYLLIPIIIAVLGSALIIFFVRRKNKKQAPAA